MLTYIGIDPGKNGAVAVLRSHGNKVWTAEVHDTPNKSGEEKDAKNRGYDEKGMAALMRGIVTDHESYACMERVNSQDHDGHVGAFSSGYGWGLWRGILATLKVPCELVDPRKWKNDQGLPFCADYDQRKEKARALAQRYFPDLAATHLSRKKDHDRAEALLIAHWWRKKHVWIREMNKPFSVGIEPTAAA